MCHCIPYNSPWQYLVESATKSVETILIERHYQFTLSVMIFLSSPENHRLPYSPVLDTGHQPLLKAELTDKHLADPYETAEATFPMLTLHNCSFLRPMHVTVNAIFNSSYKKLAKLCNHCLWSLGKDKNKGKYQRSTFFIFISGRNTFSNYTYKKTEAKGS